MPGAAARRLRPIRERAGAARPATGNQFLAPPQSQTS